MASGIHQNDIGTRFLFTIKDYPTQAVVDISSASSRQIFIKKPSDTVLTKTASILSSGSAMSGVMYYDTIAGDLDEVGFYKMQGRVTLPSGTYSTTVYGFQVNCNLS